MRGMRETGVVARRRASGRRTTEQVKRLEQVFVECPFPNDRQRCLLSAELCLEHKHLKFWFQNKRNHTKVQNNRAEIAALNANIRRIRNENSSMLENLRTARCPSCGDLSLMCEGQDCNATLLLQENAQLRQEYDRVANHIILNAVKVISESSLAYSNGSIPHHGAVSPSADSSPFKNAIVGNPGSTFDLIRIPELESFLVLEIASSSMDELIKLLLMDEVFWTKSGAEDKYDLNLENYGRIFTRAKYFRCSHMHIESSKASGLVPMNGKHLVDIFLDTDKRVDMFSTLISEARMIRVPACGELISRSGTLQLAYERTHVLSPLIQPREFYILRYCQQTGVDRWVIADITYEFDRDNPHVSPSFCVRRPSGCMIRDLSNGFSEVTWVEHVLIDACNEVPQLYRDVVLGGLAFGARRWINTLQRMVERQSYLFDDHAVYPASESENEVSLLQVTHIRKSIVRLSVKMLKSFCSRLSMCGKLDFPQPTIVNNEDIQIAIGRNTAPAEPAGYVISAATSVWLPVVPQAVFGFLCDSEKRYKWDLLCSEDGARVIAKIPSGSQEGNSISIMTPLLPGKNLIIQESSIDALGALIVYAQSTYPSLRTLSAPIKSSGLLLLPSGFTISTNGRPDQSVPSTSSSAGSRSDGCVLTALFNFLATDTLSDDPGQIGSNHQQPVSAILTSAVENIKRELCPQ